MNERYNMPLFEGITDDELHWLISHSNEVQLDTGQFMYRENEPSDTFYVVLEGELQITRTINGREQVVGTTPRGIIGGELPLLYNQPALMSARALEPTVLMVLPMQAFREMFAAVPTVATRVLEIAAGRTQGIATNRVQQEKMAALGKLSAGLAHELNNPAAAARRATSTLRELLPRLIIQAIHLSSLGLTEQHVQQVIELQQKAAQCVSSLEPPSPLEQSDREDALLDWLEAHDIAAGWDLAPAFVAAHLSPAKLDKLASWVPPNSLSDVLQWLYTTLDASSLMSDIEESTIRISDLVGAVKDYTYRDQAAVQEVDIHHGLETTLVVLKHKLKKGSITIERRYDPALPTIQARGGELNQVWTNLIDNAIDALAGEGTISIITRNEHDFAMVEVADNGSGIPTDVMPRLFEPFFTTKDVGSGTGLGLDISYRVIREHSGTVEVQSEPGCTRFIVRLPINQTPISGT